MAVNLNGTGYTLVFYKNMAIRTFAQDLKNNPGLGFQKIRTGQLYSLFYLTNLSGLMYTFQNISELRTMRAIRWTFLSFWYLCLTNWRARQCGARMFKVLCFFWIHSFSLSCCRGHALLLRVWSYIKSANWIHCRVYQLFYVHVATMTFDWRKALHLPY